MKKILLLLIISTPFIGFGQSSLQADLAAMVRANSEKVLALAEAIPEDDYSWSPAEGIRDVKGVLLHIASANYFFPTIADIEMPDGIDPMNMAKSINGKAATIEAVTASYEHFISSLKEIPDDKLGEMKDFFGQSMTVRGALLLAFGHCEEHMGQLIAYARSNDIAPPWSQSE